MRREGTLLFLFALFAGAAGCDDARTSVADPGPVTLMTLNVASGAGDRFRTAAARSSQGSFIARSGVEIVGMQEVDLQTDRSGNMDVASSIARGMGPGFDACTFADPAEPHMSADGTRLARCVAGTVVFGTGFRGDDRFSAGPDGTPTGILDVDVSLNPTGADRGADAFYGNALVVRSPWEVLGAYTVALPIDGALPGAPPELLDQLAASAPHAGAIAALAVHNVAVRTHRGVEPRSALVARVRRPGTRARTIIVTHLEAYGTPQLRNAQLDAVIAIAHAEQRGEQGRRVLVIGDFNMTPNLAAPRLRPAGFVYAAPNGSTDIGQIWVDAALTTDLAALVPTEGASDHGVAAMATVH